MERRGALRRRRGAAKRSPAPEIAPAPEILIDEPDALSPDAALPAPSLEHEPVVPLATPEPAFASRVPPPTPGPPLPASQRAIFYDVENASHPGHIARVIEHLTIDRLGWRVEFVAVGNWRVIDLDTARLLARHGAQLVHSAPSPGVRDWSDLRIAVSAGVWLAAARPGDVLEIVSDDRAFDAVGDVASALGIAFRRLSSRAIAGVPEEAPREAQAVGDKGRRGGWRGQRGGRAPAAAAEPRRVETRRHEPAHAAHAGLDDRRGPRRPLPSLPQVGLPAKPALEAGDYDRRVPHTAPHDELVHVVRELAQRSPTGAVLIDTVERTLRARGFSRPPGSPRLVTRLQRIKEFSVSPTGMITLVGEPARAEPVAAAVGEGREPGPATPRRRRRGRRGGRGRRRAGPPPTGFVGPA